MRNITLQITSSFIGFQHKASTARHGQVITENTILVANSHLSKLDEVFLCNVSTTRHPNFGVLTHDEVVVIVEEVKDSNGKTVAAEEVVVDEDGNVIESAIERVKPDMEVLEDDGSAEEEDDSDDEVIEDEDDAESDEEESEE